VNIRRICHVVERLMFMGSLFYHRYGSMFDSLGCVAWAVFTLANR
jgi:hypothetical protein